MTEQDHREDALLDDRLHQLFGPPSTIHQGSDIDWSWINTSRQLPSSKRREQFVPPTKCRTELPIVLKLSQRQSSGPFPRCRVATRPASRRSARRESGGKAVPYTVAEAAKTIGKSKAAIFRAIRKGTISAARDESSGAFLIDPAELHRAFPPASPVSTDTLPDTASDVPRFAELQGRLADAHDQIADLRRRLDQADADRRQALDRLAAAQERVAALLSDQRPAVPVPAPSPTPTRRKWWLWSRG
jgi:hypothetical protein